MTNGLNLRDQLKQILPDILPRNPADSIKGTELIQLVKFRLNQNYSDATLRYHFSIMSCDPSSPIAKVEQGQGYYLRSTTLESLESARNFITGPASGLLFTDATGPGESVIIKRANKFRAIVSRWHEMEQHFPFSLERSFSGQDAAKNQWRLPDMAVVEWLVGEAFDDGMHLDKQSLEIRRRMGGAPFRVAAVTLKLEVHHTTLRQTFFNALSSGLWAHRADLIIAGRISDEQLADELRQLGDTFGVGVTCLGLSAEDLDNLPEPASIAAFHTRELEALQSMFQIRRITGGQERPQLDWEAVNRFRNENPEFEQFYAWISRCLIDERAYSLGDFLELVRAETVEEEENIEVPLPVVAS